jgi:hypothetical protein
VSGAGHAVPVVARGPYLHKVCEPFTHLIHPTLHNPPLVHLLVCCIWVRPEAGPPTHVLHLFHILHWSTCSCVTLVSHPPLVHLLTCYTCVTPTLRACYICVTPFTGPPAHVLHLCHTYPACMLYLCHTYPACMLHLCHTLHWATCSRVTFVLRSSLVHLLVCYICVTPFAGPPARMSHLFYTYPACMLHLCHTLHWCTCSDVTFVLHLPFSCVTFVSHPSLVHLLRCHICFTPALLMCYVCVTPFTGPPAQMSHLRHTICWSTCSCVTFVSHPSLVHLLMCYNCVTPALLMCYIYVTQVRGSGRPACGREHLSGGDVGSGGGTQQVYPKPQTLNP